MLQGRIAGCVAERVVEELEVVEIEHEDRERMAVPFEHLHVPFELFLQVTAVVEAGELIGVGQAIQFSVRLLMIQSTAAVMMR